MTRSFINFSPPLIEDGEISEVVDSLRSGWITTGPKVTQFENAVCAHLGVSHAAATFACTQALFLTLTALGIGKGDEVIVPTFTFASTAHVVIHCGASPVFVDIDPSTLTMDTREVESTITPRTQAVIPVHYGGNPVDMTHLMELADRHKFHIVEDAAHAIGSAHRGTPIGALPTTGACFSFYATKNVATAEGGMLVSENEKLVRMVKKLAMYGISDAREIWTDRYSKRGSWFYDVEMIGHKANMTDLNAAIGIHQLRKLNHFNRLRQKNAEKYMDGLGETGCRFMNVHPEDHCSWHLFPLLLPEYSDRDEVIAELKEKGIGTSVLYRPLHLHTAYRSLLGHSKGDFPNSEAVYKKLINLPISPAITEADIGYIIETVRSSVVR